MTFAEPARNLALIGLPVLVLLRIWAGHRARAAIAAFASSPRLQPALLGGVSPVWSASVFVLQLLGLALVILALARPQLGTEETVLPQSGRNVFIAIDTSKSMLADDMTPNRLTRAKLAAQDLLDKLHGDKVGLIAFAGRAFLQAPLTTDHEAVRESIEALDHTSIPRGGSSLAAAINLVLDAASKTPGQRCGMVLFSDGQETDQETLAAARTAAAKQLLILPVGMGTPEGSLIPDPEQNRQGDYIRDERGTVVKSRLESDLLQQVASITGARYIELASQALSQPAVDSLLSQLDARATESRQESKPIERYQWPLGVGLLWIIVSLVMRHHPPRRPRSAPLPVEPQAQVHAPSPMGVATAPSALALALGLALFSAAALFPSPAAARQDDSRKRGAAEYADGKFESARETYATALKAEKPPPQASELNYGLGAAAHQLKDYDAAIRAFSHALESGNPDLQSRSLRGLATSLYDLGDNRAAQEPEFAIKAWTDSRDHFNDALRVLRQAGLEGSAEYREVKENRDFVQKRLDEVKRQEEQKQQQKGKQKQDQKKKEGQPQKGGEGEDETDPDDSSSQNPDQQPKKSGDQEKQKEHDQLEKKADQLPEGELKAKENPGQQGQAQARPQDDSDDKRNDKTGFTPQEARNQLRNYADDQKSAQYLMRRERPTGGKDY